MWSHICIQWNLRTASGGKALCRDPKPSPKLHRATESRECKHACGKAALASPGCSSRASGTQGHRVGGVGGSGPYLITGLLRFQLDQRPSGSGFQRGLSGEPTASLPLSPTEKLKRTMHLAGPARLGQSSLSPLPGTGSAQPLCHSCGDVEPWTLALGPGSAGLVCACWDCPGQGVEQLAWTGWVSIAPTVHCARCQPPPFGHPGLLFRLTLHLKPHPLPLTLGTAQVLAVFSSAIVPSVHPRLCICSSWAGGD